MIFRADPDQPVRLDIWLKDEIETSRSQVKALLEAGKITVNGEVVKAGTLLRGGEEISVEATDDSAQSDILPEDLPLDVIYEDASLAVVNKRQGMVVHPAAGHPDGTLVNALLYHYKTLSDCGGESRAGIVHRLDKDTSGLIVIAKTNVAHAFLAEEIASKRAHRRYLALLEGTVKQDAAEITTAYGRDMRDRKKMAVLTNGMGKIATTSLRVRRRYQGSTLAEFILGTGRTHQIRVHAASVLKHPIIGDPVYGYEKQRYKLQGQLLHAYRLTFIHPDTKKEMDFTAPLPDYFAEVLQKQVLTEQTQYDLNDPLPDNLNL